MGVVVDGEHPYVASGGLGPRWMKWFRLRAPEGVIVAARRTACSRKHSSRLSTAAPGTAASLVLAADLTWREVALVRIADTCARPARCSARRTSNRPSPAANIARRLVELFVARSIRGPARAPTTVASDLVDEIGTLLDAVTSLDDDRILRSLLHLVLATLRTNWFQSTGTEPPAVRAQARSADSDLPLPARCSRSG